MASLRTFGLHPARRNAQQMGGSHADELPVVSELVVASLAKPSEGLYVERRIASGVRVLAR
jgi:hypothetical protein